MKHAFFATIEILRPHNMLAAAICVTGGYVLSGGSDFGLILPAALFTGLVTGMGNLINDFYDRDIDRVNKPYRPLPSGRLSPVRVRRFYWIGSFVICAALVLARMAGTRSGSAALPGEQPLPLAVVALILAWQILLYLYARVGKRIVLGGGILVASIAGSAFLAGATVAGDAGAAAYPAGVAFLLILGRELLKGAEDVAGDRGAGASTPAVRFGVDRTVAWGVGLLFACVAVVPIPALLEHYGRYYLVAMETLFVPGVLAAAVLALRSTEPPVLRRASSILKVQIYLGIVALVSARF